MLSTPPAFILSQDQTLMFKFVSSQNCLASLEHLALVFSTLTCDTYLTLSENELLAKFELSSQISFLFTAFRSPPLPPCFHFLKGCCPSRLFPISWIFLFESFKGISLFNYQGSFVPLSHATLTSYHLLLRLSTTFFIFYPPPVSQWNFIISPEFLSVNTFVLFFRKIDF